MGGVLLDLNIDRCLQSFKERAGCAYIEKYLDRFHQKGFIGDMEAGKITEEEFYVRCLRHCAPGTTKEVVFNCFVDLLDGLNEEVMEVVRSLYGRYPLYILSNNNPLSIRVFKSLTDSEGNKVADYFTKFFFSFEMKLLKPCLEIYQKAVESIGLPPEEILFIDDSQVNVDAASALGIRTILYEKGKNVLSKQIFD